MGFDGIDHIVRHEFIGMFWYCGISHNVTVKTYHNIATDEREVLFAVDGAEIRDEELIDVISEELRGMGHDI